MIIKILKYLAYEYAKALAILVAMIVFVSFFYMLYAVGGMSLVLIISTTSLLYVLGAALTGSLQ